MKIKYLFFLFIPALFFSQNKNDWFFGVEIGNNTITSRNLENKNSFQGGVLAEYYFARQWSATGRLKYFKTGTTNNTETGYFDGAVVSIPLNIKWEYKMVKNFKGNFNTGVAFNQEVKSNYYYPPNQKTDYSKFFGTFNIGVGFSYFINSKTAVFINYESYILGNNRDERNGLQILPNSTNNNLFNIGIKYNFKK